MENAQQKKQKKKPCEYKYYRNLLRNVMLIQVLDYSCKTFAKPYLVLLKKIFFLVFTLIQYWGWGVLQNNHK